MSIDSLCDNFADHFKGKIDSIRCSLLPHHNIVFNVVESFPLSEETLESFVSADAEMLGNVFSQLNPTNTIWNQFPHYFITILLIL